MTHLGVFLGMVMQHLKSFLKSGRGHLFVWRLKNEDNRIPELNVASVRGL